MAKEKLYPSWVIIDILLTIFTLGIWNLWVQLRQIRTINKLAGEDKFWPLLIILLLSIFTFGIYFAYHEYKSTRILHELKLGYTKPFVEIPIALLTFLGLWFIVDSYQQAIINDIIIRRS